jgi:hypothetical protein
MTKGLGKALLVGGFAVAVVSATPAIASTDGTFGATSQGTVVISATVPGRVKLTKLSDVTFTNVDPSVAASDAQNVCVWSNTAGRKYTIAATGSGASNAFTLAAGSSTVNYSVQWAQTSGQTSGTALTSGVALANQSSAAVAQDCGGAGATSASLVVGIAATELQSMTAATAYTGTLTLLVSAQ